MVQSQAPPVMYTLGVSLHVVASLLGEKIVEEELVPVFEEMIQVLSRCNFSSFT